MDRLKKFIDAATGDMLWAVILVPILAISWLGFYTIARAVGVPPVFAAGMSAAFDGVAIFAARIGLKHRRKGFSGWLARITVLLFAALGAFVQSFHSDTTVWVHEHAWIVWATAPVAAVLAYELHLGWAHRKQLIKRGYVHPSAKSGFGPATWIVLEAGVQAFGSRRFAFLATAAFVRIEDAPACASCTATSFCTRTQAQAVSQAESHAQAAASDPTRAAPTFRALELSAQACTVYSACCQACT